MFKYIVYISETMEAKGESLSNAACDASKVFRVAILYWRCEENGGFSKCCLDPLCDESWAQGPFIAATGLGPAGVAQDCLYFVVFNPMPQARTYAKFCISGHGVP